MSDGARLGRVILVGAGPGAPDLITLRGAEALRNADAVVYDALAPDALLDLAPPEALRVNVGKRGHEMPTIGQDETTALLIRLALEGRCVVRLKGGDPFLFARGGEEATACVDAGIPVEIIPGVSSVTGALAYAGIPATDRRHAASFAVVTGHKDPTKVTGETRFDRLAQAADTLVVLMGMRNLEAIVDRALAGGLSRATPAAVVMDGTLPTQRVVEGPLGELVARVREAGLRSPAVVAIGDVVSLRAKLAWWEREPLFGMRVLVTRAAEQAGELASALAAAGAEPVLVPLLEIEAVRDPGPIDAALARLDDYDLLLFTSANAVRFTLARARAKGVSLDAARADVLCVGPRTAEEAHSAGLRVRATPATRFDAEGLLEEVQRQLDPDGLRVLLPRAETARDVLPDGLRAAGARVDAVPVYRNAAPDVDAGALCGALSRGELGALTFVSPSAAKRFAALLDAPGREAARRCLCVAIGPVTAEALREAGLPPTVVAQRAGSAGLVRALREAAAARAPDAEEET